MLCSVTAHGACASVPALHARASGIPAVWVQSILDLRVMTRDCKKEARHFDNGLQELAYDAAQVCEWASPNGSGSTSFVQHSSQRGVWATALPVCHAAA